MKTQMRNVKNALVLSGGGSRGAYQIGAASALDEMGFVFDIVTGTSVGAINGALVVQSDLKLAVSLWKELETDMIFGLDSDDAFSYAKEILSHGGASTEGLKNMLDQYINEDKVRISEADYGLITVELTKHGGLKKHELMKAEIPQGQMIPYIMASAACFPAVKEQSINDKKYIDGGYADNLPIELAKENGATKVIAINLNAVGVLDRKAINYTDNLTMIESKWDLGNFLIFDSDNSKHLIRLGYLETMKQYGYYSGKDYIFENGEYDDIKQRGADEAGKIFSVDPAAVYTRSTFNDALKNAVVPFIEKAQDEIKNQLTNIKNRKSFLSSLLHLAKEVNHKTLVLLISQELKNDDTGLLSKPMISILKDEILAANYINKAGFLSADEQLFDTLF